FATKEAALLIVVIKSMFVPEELEKGGAEAIVELEQELVEGLSSLCPIGDEIKKITIFKSHPDAVILVRFKDAILAQECVQLMNGRFFDGRKIEASLWDGVTEYAPKDDVVARMAEQAKRMEAFDEWLESRDEEDEAED
ncbi:MAG TPA: hypothetical protein VEF04_20940, partial [Blastocatellia bacterium]|nr:hypothetical protein [Blastocatellia bacterium]